METALTIFNFEGRDIHIQTINGEPWWIASEVCETIGLGNSREAIKRLDEDEVSSNDIIDSMGRDQTVNIVNEPGLYSLVLSSRKKEAKAFKRWITHEVLPSIRKTGGYQVAQRDPISEIERLAVALVPIAGTVKAMDNRLSRVEERQKQIDPLEIEHRMAFLKDCKTLLVNGTKGKPQAVTHQKFWQELKPLIGISSFQNRAALTVEMMEKCMAYAREWCETRGVNPPTLFDAGVTV